MATTKKRRARRNFRKSMRVRFFVVEFRYRFLSARGMLSEILNERHTARHPALSQRQPLPVARPGEVENPVSLDEISVLIYLADPVGADA
jgi:hypothetical protein